MKFSFLFQKANAHQRPVIATTANPQVTATAAVQLFRDEPFVAVGDGPDVLEDSSSSPAVIVTGVSFLLISDTVVVVVPGSSADNPAFVSTQSAVLSLTEHVKSSVLQTMSVINQAAQRSKITRTYYSLFLVRWIAAVDGPSTTVTPGPRKQSFATE